MYVLDIRTEILDDDFGIALGIVRLGDVPKRAEPVSYAWDFDGDGTADVVTNKSTFTKTFTSGTYPVKLTAVDATSGGSASYERLAPIIVDRAIASFEMSETSGMEPLPVTLTANCPWIGDHPQYSWDFNGDGVIDLITAEASALPEIFTSSPSPKSR